MQHDHGQVEHAVAQFLGGFFAHLFQADFPPRGDVIAWQPDILWLHVVSDALIAIAFYSIPLALLFYIRRKRDLSFLWMHALFALFILSCGTTHLLNALAFWHPMYRLDGLVKAVTALLAVAAAISLWPLIPRALAIPSPAAVAAANAALAIVRDELDARVRDRTAELERVNARLEAEVAERRRVEATLRDSDERFRLALAAAPITVFSQDRDLRYTWINGRHAGMAPGPVEGKTDDEVFDESAAAALTELKRRVLTTGAAVHAEVPITVEGRRHYFDFRAEPLRDAVGHETGITGVKVDITERKRAEQHRAFLLAELDHRVKNNLSVVLALAEESIRASGSLEDFSRAFVGRVRALAKTHAALAASRWEGVKLGDLIDLTLESYMMSEAPDGVERVVIAGEPVQLSPKAASALCMTINELVTNAAKYGAFSVPGGRVTIQWVRRPEAGEHDILHLEWQESGGPPVSPPDHRSLGTQLIEEGVAYEMGGVVRTEYRPEGVVCIVEFPLSDQNTRRGRFEETVSRAGEDA